MMVEMTAGQRHLTFTPAPQWGYTTAKGKPHFQDLRPASQTANQAIPTCSPARECEHKLRQAGSHQKLLIRHEVSSLAPLTIPCLRE